MQNWEKIFKKHGKYFDEPHVDMPEVVKFFGEHQVKNEYCWIFKFRDDKIISITAYYDSLLVNKTLNENEVRYE
ncbi:MAG: hypothetical protein PVG30_03835 [Gammaproteobacteria bacterium]|jgi:ketosteroid isomerase-like protein